MTWTRWNRQIHRWLSIIFILSVLTATYAAASGQAATSLLYYLPLPPLFLLMFTGLYMFVLPYVQRWRGTRRAVQQE